MWEVIYNDGSSLSEIEGDTEHLFKEIDLSKLHFFDLFIGDKIYSLNIYKGIFTINNQKIGFSEFEGPKKLIYFKSVRQSLGDNSGPETTYNLGFQHERGKVIMKITKDLILFDIK